MSSDKERIFLSPPHLAGDELDYLRRTLESNWIAPVGPEIDSFEEAIGRITGVDFVLALNSCTSALHLALKMLKVGNGDLVLVQSHTFIASAHSVSYTGAEPIFIDSEELSWNMDPAALRKALDDLSKRDEIKRVKAIMLVHSYGIPAKIDDIIQIAVEFNIPVLEDAAESMGSTWKDRHTGTFGTYGAFSFNGNKIITTSGGGALVCPNSESKKEALFLATQAKDSEMNALNGSVGYNYRLSNVLAAMGTAQIKVLSERVEARRKVFENYRNYFEKWSAQGIVVSFQQEWKGSRSNRWMSNILLDSSDQRDMVKEVLSKQNIESRFLRNPMHLNKAYNSCRVYNAEGEVSDKRYNTWSAELFRRGLSLPSGSSISNDQWLRIEQALDEALESFS